MQLEPATRRPAAALNNRILRALGAEERGEVIAQATETPLYRGQVLYRCGDAVRHFYFINRGLISLMLDTADGRSVEVGGRGVEALTMPETVFGPERATLHSVVQVPGSAFLIERPALLALATRIARLRELIHGYVHASIQQIAQTSACNRLHTLDQRFSRWLLVAHESACSDGFPVTHEYFSLILGVGRSTLSLTAEKMRRAGYITYSRGQVQILDVRGLEANACECYRIIRNHHDRLFADSGKTP